LCSRLDHTLFLNERHWKIVLLHLCRVNSSTQS
jgi:hypothetical protein